MDVSDYENLIAAVVGQGVREEGADYLLDPCASWWLGLVGVDPERAWVQSTRQSVRVSTHRFTPRSSCSAAHTDVAPEIERTEEAA